MNDEIKEAIEAMEANEPQANLYRAAEEYVSDQAYELMGFGDDDDFNKLAELMKQAVLYGAHWKEQQIMKAAVEGQITLNEMGNPCVMLPSGFNAGDEVKLIVLKEDKV